MTPTLSYVVPLYNKERTTIEFTQRALSSIREHTKSMSYEIILVDNRSPEHEPMKMTDLRSEVYGDATVICMPQNVGYGVACNLGFRAARGEYLVCMNSDAAQVEDTPEVLRKAMLQYGLAVAMPEHWEACNQANLSKSDTVMGTDWFFGAYWMSTRSFIVETMGGFDTEYYDKCYYEDTDLWSRCFQAGYKVAGYRGTWVKHHGNASALPNLTEIFLRNRQKYIDRWGSEHVVVK